MILYCDRKWRDEVGIPRYWKKALMRITRKKVKEMILLKSTRIMIVGEVVLDLIEKDKKYQPSGEGGAR